jgi:hypothetical protein
MRHTMQDIHKQALAVASACEEATTASLVLVDMTGDEITTDPPEPIKPAPPGDGETINGHSRKADADGFATVPTWPRLFELTIEAHEASTGKDVSPALVAEIWGKSPKRLRCESVRQNCVFPSIEAKLACTQDMGSRRRIAQQLGDTPDIYDAILIKVAEKPVPAKIDYFVSPESQASGRYDFTDVRVLTRGLWQEAEPAWCFNFDPARDVEYANKLYVQFILDELKPKDPIDG